MPSYAVSESERRTQARLSVQIPVQLQDARQKSVYTATLMDLSWGGALCQTATELPIASEQSIWLRLPWTGKETIDIEAVLLRQKALESNRYMLALRFQRLSIFNQTRLEKLLGQLQGTNEQDTQHAANPLVATLEVQIQTVGEWRGALSEIAKGQLQIASPLTLTAGQSAALQFNGVPTRAQVRLRARVLESIEMPRQRGSLERLYRITLAFEHPLKVLQQWAEWLLNQFVVVDNSTQSSVASAATGIIPARVVLTRTENSALEIGFPETLDYLMTVWGNINAFETIFQRLTFGDLGLNVEWTPEAWAELQFLQDIHDRAYGLSNARLSPWL
ncbi:PilZ domain-containing protein [Allochromatium warmingii]|uniref:PilZ domain-containing protein n=1 Tax=Allochromatium warmingii TaxID=61595 RepID=A0A1H3HC77_ALLWA|nr:PilZ domain-containing protein [Allochromatium warmingii]SDY12239.1 PilZ domain-containing protein [Allochromatium warmingii]